MTRKEQIKALWRLCFNDPEDYIQLYFDRVYKEEQALTIERDGKIISALQLMPYTMTWCGTEITMAYIYAACTDPAERGKGLMRDLLQKAFHEMRRRDYDITSLIPAEPWLFDYYRKHGYTEIFDYSVDCYICPENRKADNSIKVITPDFENENYWYTYFDSKLRERSCCVLHTKEDFHTIIADSRLSEGKILGAVNKQGRPVGLAFVVADEKEAIVKELLYNNDTVKELLLWEAVQAYNFGQVMYKHNANPENSFRQGMAMIINRPKLIWHWLAMHPDMPFTAEELNGMENETLTRNLFNYSQREAFMSLMLD